ncbi:MAG: Histidine-tRNA ligase [Parcubacteria group bacterium GW2011_GWC1_43_61]|nr:MAG: Histidine-tRNA ligase [Candidatus Azambacteria bacterium GW2011_GWF1_41_10]KKS49451.1 MAG: Histidine-tRNA ligase [Candidatus Azambacteria bacterium GW2011_GWF2_42_22]KKS69645.1 MAG: Histidine-tRNA ligase [Candidatus Azambacteria bacterium GW2011_GWA2_42_62]KKS74481.1 MAG: Histidine-tRNA ligase [Candidatus Azambacteria bacterium GW2011_GWB1_42_72]KKT03562.1 MAG: Histidine-tRNA ligase [Candidatus Azambacteria bacterium GW2011_GWD1_43_18]KKT12716.1 MAG: Histidine-tRNA ligase [Candidatus A
MFKSTKASFDGFRDIFGHEARLREFVAAKISETFQLWGYDKIELSMIESIDSFSERVVGGSPWPEWDQKCSFQLDICDYARSYDNAPIFNRALLVPEGTVSASRWLANQIDTKQELRINFPLKIYYVVNCFRNEPISNLSATKTRSFAQVGMEVIGTSNRYADLETIIMVADSMEAIGASKSQIKVRLGDIRIFNHLCEKCMIPYRGTIVLKEVFDAIAESRAGNDIKRLDNELAKADKILSVYAMSPNSRSQWDFCLAGIRQSINCEEMSFLNCSEAIRDLNFIAGELNKLDIPAVIDLAVVRSHEYYTGAVFEIDAIVNDRIIVEIAGGGRYNKLIGRLSNKNIEVSAVGFAFGLERICCLAENPQNLVNLEIYFWLNKSSADIVLYGQGSANSLINFAQQLRKDHKRVDIYAGNHVTVQEAASYAAKRGAQLMCVGG